ncbi:AAA family ATPase [Actinoplanes sp. TRM 88003]|uniref:AAA family ATPase n=1 Tax=Paractinoplanes aksuensis TaxID=2939490 RepID=A0ABT1DHB0_9ACTN|nr:AAA family ATPase [Actinoplanes aksuensis]MCO8269878.1 AAA family ATPase [Actinoplanes aksuensis]
MGSRADDAAAVLAVIESAAGGHSGTLLISGEAGVGKTTLVREACAATRGHVLWAPCLPLTSLSVPLLPLRTALRSAPDPPELGHADALLAFDTWLDEQNFSMAVEAIYCILDNHEGPTWKAMAEDVRASRTELERAGALHVHVSEVCSVEAELLLMAGDWRVGLDRLRDLRQR